MTDERLKSYLAERKAVVEQALAHQIKLPGRWPGKLYEAMSYAALGGGKRLRPILTLAAADAVSKPQSSMGWDQVLPVACALELIHCYSLVHDDLPAMDDDDERRGRPTVHKAYREDLAILVGDALLTEAFSIVADFDRNGGLEGLRAARVVKELARAAGPQGMVGGQSMDMGWEGPIDGLTELNFLHRRKTGELFRCAVWLGGFVAGARSAQLEALSAYGESLGLAFQIADDLLDAGEDDDEANADERETPSYLRFLGEDGTREQARLLADRAIEHLEVFDDRADPLRSLANYAVSRSY